MNFKTVIFTVLIFSGGLLSAQEIVALSLVTYGGGSAVTSAGIVEWSLGQTAISTRSLSNDLVTQGFHQPEFTLVGTDDLATYEVEVFPNPTHGQLQIRGNGDFSINRYEIIDMQGLMVDMQTVGSQKSVTLNTSSLSKGYYVLRVILGDVAVNAVFCRN